MDATGFKRMREGFRFTQAEFGRILGFGTPQSRVAEIETGRRRVSAHVERICFLLGYLERAGKFDEVRPLLLRLTTVRRKGGK